MPNEDLRLAAKLAALQTYAEALAAEEYDPVTLLLDTLIGTIAMRVKKGREDAGISLLHKDIDNCWKAAMQVNKELQNATQTQI